MPTTTTRLALSKPLGSETVDIDVLNANADKLDAAAGATICTSTTRPASPYSGQIIYETDTKLTWTYSGGWKLDTGIQPVVASASARDALFPSPIQGNSVFRNDIASIETYYSATANRSAGWYQEPAGRILQVFTGFKNTMFSTTSSTYVSTGLVVSVTPKYSNSIIIVTASTGVYGGGNTINATIFRGGQNLGNGDSGLTLWANNVASGAPMSLTAYDLPNTTSSVDYYVAVRQYTTGTAYSPVQASNSYIIAYEVAR